MNDLFSPPAESTLEGTLERVVYANEESAWSVVKVTPAVGREAVTAVGRLLGVQPGETLRLEGAWEEDRKFGRQFRVSSYRTVTPATLEGIEKYLGSGLIPGIGKGMAKRLVAHFGHDTLEVIERQPQRLAEVPGIGPKRSGEIQKAWVDQREIKEVMVFLQSHGVTTHHAIRIYKTYGPGALAVVRKDPYRLAIDVHGIGFLSADKVAASLGLPADSPQRARAGAAPRARRGERPRPRLPAARAAARGRRRPARPRHRGADAGPRRARRRGAGGGRGGGRRRGRRQPRAGTPPSSCAPCTPPRAGSPTPSGAIVRRPGKPLKIDVERALAWFEAQESIELAGEQRAAIRAGIRSQVLVITGGPGTGKTTLVRGIVRILAAKKQRVLLAAPTGRAAKRLAEATGKNASTVHRLLEFEPQSRAFQRGPERPLNADLLIVDEASMLDVSLAWSLVRAVPPGGRLVLVGDVDQLPSVGPGRVLADVIDSGAVEVVRLRDIFRQAQQSLIVVNAHRVNRGEMPSLKPDPGGDGRGDFFFFERRTPEEVLETLLHVVAERIPAGFGLDPLRDLQVLTPMNRGPLGTENLNRELRARLNPPRGGEVELARGERVFRVGDKVMQVRNNYELEVFNGDLGRVAAVDAEDKRLHVELEDGRSLWYEANDLDELVAAFACSIHKSQGSEYPAVVVPLHTQHYVMLERNLLYTALTRARRLVVLVGERAGAGGGGAATGATATASPASPSACGRAGRKRGRGPGDMDGPRPSTGSELVNQSPAVASSSSARASQGAATQA